MKKFSLLCCASALLLFGLAGCENSGSSSSYKELLSMGKYIGMEQSNVNADLEKSGWKLQSNESMGGEMYYKKISGNEVYVDFYSNGTQSSIVNGGAAYIFCKDSYKQAVKLYNGVGETYTFENFKNGAKAYLATCTGCYSNSGESCKSKSTYSEGKTLLAENNFDYCYALWGTKSTEYSASFQIASTPASEGMQGVSLNWSGY